MSTIKQLADVINTSNNSYDSDLSDKLTDIYFEIQNHRELMNKQSPVYDESADGSYIEDQKDKLIEILPMVITDNIVELVNNIYSIDLTIADKKNQELLKINNYANKEELAKEVSEKLGIEVNSVKIGKSSCWYNKKRSEIEKENVLYGYESFDFNDFNDLSNIKSEIQNFINNNNNKESTIIYCYLYKELKPLNYCIGVCLYYSKEENIQKWVKAFSGIKACFNQNRY